MCAVSVCESECVCAVSVCESVCVSVSVCESVCAGTSAGARRSVSESVWVATCVLVRCDVLT